MTSDDPVDDLTPSPDAEQIGARSELLPEEAAAGSDAPGAQAAAILAESAERTEDPEAAPDTFVERRTSDEAAGSG